MRARRAGPNCGCQIPGLGRLRGSDPDHMGGKGTGLESRGRVGGLRVGGLGSGVRNGVGGAQTRTTRGRGAESGVRNGIRTCVGEAKVKDICPGPAAGAGAAAASA